MKKKTRKVEALQKFFSSFSEMYKRGPSAPKKRCPICNGRGKLKSPYERLNAATGLIELLPDNPCLFCAGKGVIHGC